MEKMIVMMEQMKLIVITCLHANMEHVHIHVKSDKNPNQAVT